MHVVRSSKLSMITFTDSLPSMMSMDRFLKRTELFYDSSSGLL